MICIPCRCSGVSFRDYFAFLLDQMDKDSSDGCVSLSASLSWLVFRFGRLEFLALAVVVCFQRVHLFAFGEVLDITVVGHVTSSLWRSCRVHAICDIKSSFVADVPLQALPARGCPALAGIHGKSYFDVVVNLCVFGFCLCCLSVGKQCARCRRCSLWAVFGGAEVT